MTRRLAAPLALLLAVGCSQPAPRAIRRAAPAATAPPATRWFVTERAGVVLDEGLAPGAEPREAILDGVRVELRAGSLVTAFPHAERLRGFRRIDAGRGGYVLWSSARTFTAPTFGGDLRVLVDAAAVGGVRPWLGGLLLRTDAGALELDPASRRVRASPFVGLADAVAVDARRAARVDALGRVDVTRDGGATWTDVASSRGFLADAIRALPSGAILLHAPRGPNLELAVDGELRPARDPPRPPRSFTASRPLAAPTHGLASSALAEAVVTGVPLGPDLALVGRAGGVRLVSLASGRIVDDRDLPPVGERPATACQVIRPGDELLAVCVREGKAAVFPLADGVDGVHAEATFDGPGFVGGPRGRLGHIGACGPSRPPPSAADREAGDERHGRAGPPEARYCARLPGGHWVERVLRGPDAAHLARWIPGDGGRVTALVVGDDANVEKPAEGVRVVRLAPKRGVLEKATVRAPRSDAAVLVDVDAWEEDDGSLRAWLTGTPIVPIRIDRRGVATALPLPEHLSRLAAAGAFALGSTPARDGAPARRLASRDGGASFREIAPPPGRLEGVLDDPAGCGPLGCAWESGLVRVGWGDEPAPAPAAATSSSAASSAASAPASSSSAASSSAAASSAAASSAVVSPRAPPSAVPAAPPSLGPPPPNAFDRLHVTCRVSSAEAHGAPAAPRIALVPPATRAAPRAGAVEVAAPLDPAAAPRRVTLPSELAGQPPNVVPVLGARGVDLLLWEHTRSVRPLAGASSPQPFDVEGRPGIGAEVAGGVALLDADAATVFLARAAGVVPIARLVQVANVARVRLTLARRLDADAVAVAGYSVSSGELWAGPLDLARGEVGRLAPLGPLRALTDLARCPARPRTHRVLLELPASVRLEGERPSEQATTATVLALAGDGLLCAEALEARAGPDVLVTRLDARGDATLRRDTAPSLRATCSLAR